MLCKSETKKGLQADFLRNNLISHLCAILLRSGTLAENKALDD